MSVSVGTKPCPESTYAPFRRPLEQLAAYRSGATAKRNRLAAEQISLLNIVVLLVNRYWFLGVFPVSRVFDEAGCRLRARYRHPGYRSVCAPPRIAERFRAVLRCRLGKESSGVPVVNARQVRKSRRDRNTGTRNA